MKRRTVVLALVLVGILVGAVLLTDMNYKSDVIYKTTIYRLRSENATRAIEWNTDYPLTRTAQAP
jgi:hypothetical protein